MITTLGEVKSIYDFFELIDTTVRPSVFPGWNEWKEYKYKCKICEEVIEEHDSPFVGAPSMRDKHIRFHERIRSLGI